MKRHPNALRTRVVEFVKANKSKVLASKTFKVARQTVYEWMRLDSLGSLLEVNNYITRKSKINIEELTDYVNQNPDLYYTEIATHFKSSKSEIHYLLKKLNYTVKKNKRSTRKEIKN